MKTTRLTPILVLVVALTALVATVGYAVANTTGTGWGSGQMHRGAYTMMGSGGTSTAWYTDGTGPVRDIASARVKAQRFADRLGLKTAEVMQFSNNFYVVLDDKAGHGATEVLVDPRTGSVTLEYGPAMMWNSRYGMMGGQGGMMGGSSQGGMMGSGSQGGMMGGSSQGGMMGSGGAQGGMMGGSSQGGMMGSGGAQGGMMGGSSQGGMMGSAGSSPSETRSDVKTPVAAPQARRLANRWLSLERSGATASEPEQLPGYFTMDTSRNGTVDGMISVNARTGAVWYHWWHGRFVTMET